MIVAEIEVEERISLEQVSANIAQFIRGGN